MTSKYVTFNRDAFIAYVTEKTLKWNTLSFTKRIEPPKISEKAQKVVNLILDGQTIQEFNYGDLDDLPFGNLTQPLFELMEVILEEDFGILPDTRRNRLKYDRHLIVVSTCGDNGHDYPLNEPLMIINGSEGYAITKSGVTENHLPINSLEMRPATETEIRDFFKDMPFERIYKYL